MPSAAHSHNAHRMVVFKPLAPKKKKKRALLLRIAAAFAVADIPGEWPGGFDGRFLSLRDCSLRQCLRPRWLLQESPLPVS